jgi:menaquinone-specific isochorismate synthase
MSTRPSVSGSAKATVPQTIAALRQIRPGDWRLLEPPRPSGLARAELEVELEDPLAWLQALSSRASSQVSCYWSNREGSRAAAGIGAAATVRGAEQVDHQTVVDQLTSYLGSSPSQRAYGGFSFTGSPAADTDWAEFGSYRFTVPRLELVRSAGGCILACNYGLQESSSLPTLLQQLLPDGSQSTPAVADWLRTGSAAPLEQHNSPDEASWRAAVEHVLQQLAGGDGDANPLQKAVLARLNRVRFRDAISPLRTLARLRTVNPHAFQFLLQPAAGVAFFGASPERLVRVRGRRLATEALAGTRPRGDSVESDRELEQLLRTSTKEQHEHRLVHDAIYAALAGLCESIDVRETVSVRKLAHVQHLDTPFQATLLPGRRIGDVLGALHPTPAVGGYPQAAALAAIASQEPFERGWYAAPFGWVDAEGGEFAVAIRSALAIDATLNLYAGSGIVTGSDPAREWDETEQKMQQLLEAI